MVILIPDEDEEDIMCDTAPPLCPNVTYTRTTTPAPKTCRHYILTSCSPALPPPSKTSIMSASSSLSDSKFGSRIAAPT